MLEDPSLEGTTGKSAVPPGNWRDTVSEESITVPSIAASSLTA